MTDRELIELAAKAAGIEVEPDAHIPSGGIWLSELGGDKPWNPLTDDGDALRLAVKLGVSDRVPLRICIEYQDDGEQDFTCIEHFGENTVYHDGDPFEAARRAIVIVAAKIGESMP